MFSKLVGRCLAREDIVRFIGREGRIVTRCSRGESRGGLYRYGNATGGPDGTSDVGGTQGFSCKSECHVIFLSIGDEVNEWTIKGS